jgi:ABC-type antimicrobial peptide transport system permease subunit
VTARYREIGVRLALGARALQVVWLVLGEGAALTLAGVAVGLAGAGVAAWWLRSELFGVRAWDPLSFGSTLPILAAAALAACLLPALHALRTDPVDALRGE